MMETMQKSCILGFPKVIATPIAPKAMPSEPTMSKGLRPSFSTVKIATQVKLRFTIPLNTVSTIGLSNPIAS